MPILRTRFKKQIVCEFLPPARKSSKAVIIVSGCPSVPRKDELLMILARKGYWVFFPRYRGAWESGGKFLARSPHEDIKDVIDGIHSGFTELWSGRKYEPELKQLFLIGSSFGGPAVLLNARDERVSKVIAISPVVNWKIQARSKSEPWEPFTKFVREAFGNGYRFRMKDWNKLKRGGFYDPAAHASEIPGDKVLIIHAQDDEIVDFRPVERFAGKIKCKLTLPKRGGHGLNLSSPRNWKRIERFLKSSSMHFERV